ncbi:prephenate dehydratase [Petrotoga olearia]|uniref:Prephenate dehydratase n=2 Tax=Petrotoga olearia TaxID=156203 RepID=A0A2K1NZY9_9BACT|nr:prephenate dehydratase [Petrotoga olearia]PNR96105.1 prephenate dehydratase [Petrotoga olearia DSM 13574]RMA71540.1 prephenate dehydratase/chorismate mutase/prephenate dehydratase [Petrotoga olearia]
MKKNQTLKCGYLGPKGTFSEIAVMKYFGENVFLIPLQSISDVFEMVQNKEVDFGVVPIENSVEGSVNITMDLLFEKSDIHVVGECVVPINHFLVSYGSLDLAEVKKLFSHQQAIGQCSKFIKNRLNNPDIIFTASTANACEMIKDVPESAAIGSENIINIYNLKVLARDIQDSKNNSTRFFIIANSERFTKIEGTAKNYKTSIICSPKHNEPGVLYNMLKAFKEKDINLTRIESRPTKKQLGEYSFYIDFEGFKEDKDVREALVKLEKMSSFFKILGSYPKWKERE